jgi:hydrophobic/amphiphilic exporter-1 (mainly G- bacteria), HAE1 family
MNLLPRDDQSEFLVNIITPEGYTLERSRKIFTEIEGRLKELPAVQRSFVIIGDTEGRSGKGQGDVTSGSIYFRIKDLGQRDYSQFDVMRQAREILKEYPELRTAVCDNEAISSKGFDTRKFQVTLLGPDLDSLQTYSSALKKKISQIPGMVDVDTTLSLRKPELRVNIDRDRASDLGITVSTLANTLSVLVGGQIVSQYKEQGEPYDVWLRAEKEFRATPQNLEAITIPSPKAGLVRLTNLGSLEETLGPSQIDRVNRQRSVTLMGNPEAISVQEAFSLTQQIVKDMKLPSQYRLIAAGETKFTGDTFYYFIIALMQSVVLMYLILSAQFESWLDPLSIMAALPVTVPFGLLSLLFFRQPLDIFAMFGLFMLVGIVKKNGILQVDKTNDLRRRGKDRDAAIIEANHIRLRPILMTTVMLVAAMIPIAVGRGPGAGARASMAKVVIGGQMLSLLLALLVTPVTYSLMDSLRQSLQRIRSRVVARVVRRRAAVEYKGVPEPE